MRQTAVNEFKGKIYIIKNTVNNKVYIGETTTSIDKRLIQHISQSFYEKSSCYNCRFHMAIRELGKDVFYIEELETVCCYDELELKIKLKELEKKYIKEFDSFENGYNSNSGSNGGSVVATEVKERLSTMCKQNKQNLERLIKGNKERSKAVDVYDYYTGDYLENYNSIKEVAIKYNIDASYLTKVCKGKSKYATLDNRRCKLTYAGNTYEREFQFKVTDDIGSFIDYCIDSYDIKRKYGVDYSAVCRVCNGEKQSAGKLNGHKLIWSYYETNSD